MDATQHYTENNDVANMMDVFIDNIVVVFSGRVFQQRVDFQIGTNSAPCIASILVKWR
jgi:hypothetical protein